MFVLINSELVRSPIQLPQANAELDSVAEGCADGRHTPQPTFLYERLGGSRLRSTRISRLPRDDLVFETFSSAFTQSETLT